MESFKKTIEEMQRKINIINDDIEEIKNGRNSYKENKRIKINKANAFLNSYHKRKNLLKDNINGNANNNNTNNTNNNNNINNNNNNTNNNNSLNFIHNKNFTNSNYTLNLNKTGKSIRHLKKTNFNIENANLDEKRKNNIMTNEINNSSNINNIDINNKKDLKINYINDYTYKKNNTFIKKYKSSLSTMNVNDGKKKFTYKYGSINHKKKNEINNDLNNNTTLYQNYCYMKKNLNINNINVSSNNFNSSQTINNEAPKNNKAQNNNISKDMNSFTSIKGAKRIRKIIVEKKNHKVSSQHTPKNFFNNKFSMKNNKKNNIYNNDNHNNNNSNNNINNKTIDINYNYSYNNKNLLYETDDQNGDNTPIRIKTRNINNDNIIINNSKEDYIKIKDKSVFEDINIKSKRSMSIENPKLKYSFNTYKFNKNLKINDAQDFQDISPTNANYEDNKSNIENIKYKKKVLEKKFNYEQILSDIIDITNEYNNNMENKASMNNIIDVYKLLLYDMKTKNEFIYKIINLYNKSNDSNLNFNDIESLIPTWNWIKDSQNKLGYYKIKNETENMQYKKLCKDIMKEYNLKNIQQLKKFIHKLCKKIDKNENFLEGIKKILLP